jgi:hypothetical protein
VTAATQAVAQGQADVAKTRQSLAAATTKADGDTLFLKLEQLTITLRSQERELVEAQESAAIAQKQLGRAQSRLARATGASVQADAELSAAGADATTRAGWKQQLAQGPLATLPADASAALAGPTYQAAKARLEGGKVNGQTVDPDIPTALVLRARERETAEVTRLVNLRGAATVAQDSLNGKLASDNGLAGQVASKSAALSRAEDAFGGYVLTAGDRLQAALGRLAAIPQAPPLTADQKKAINDPAAQGGPGTALLAAEKARDADLVALEKAEADLEAAVVKAVMARPNADPSTDPGVQQATAARDAAKGVLASAETAFTPGMRDTLHSWEAAVPDYIWQLLDDFDASTRTLTALAPAPAAPTPAPGTTTPATTTAPAPAAPAAPGDLAAAVDKADAELAAALDAAFWSQSAVQAGQDAVEDTADRVEARVLTIDRRVLSALRGDG